MSAQKRLSALAASYENYANNAEFCMRVFKYTQQIIDLDEQFPQDSGVVRQAIALNKLVADKAKEFEVVIS